MKWGIRKLLSAMLCIVVVLTCLMQSVVPAYGYMADRTGEFSWVLSSGEVRDYPWNGKFVLVDKNENPMKEKDVFGVSCSVIHPSVIDEVYKETVTYSVYSNSVEFTVYGGIPIEAGSDLIYKTKGAEIASIPYEIEDLYNGQLVKYRKVGNPVGNNQTYEYNNYKITRKISEIGIYPDFIDVAYENGTIRLYKTGEPTQAGLQTYAYVKKLYNYSHEIKIEYAYNEAPIITEIKNPLRNKSYNDEQNSIINIQGKVSDKNIGDKLRIKYSIDKYGDSIEGEFLNEDIIEADGNSQTFTGSIDIKKIPDYDLLEQNTNHTLYIWAVDAKNKRSPLTNVNSITFNFDTKHPDSPTLVQDPKGITKDDVKVTITFPEDVVKREYKIGPDGAWEIYTNPIPVAVNTAVYGRGTDAAGNCSDESFIDIGNIDKVKPLQPIITANPENSEGEPIKVSIKPGTDNRSAVCEVVYAVTDDVTTPDDKEFVKYKGEFEIINEGKYIVWAKTVDEAGNLSDVAQKPASIKKPTPTPTPVPSPSTNSGNPVVPINPSQNVPTITPVSSPSTNGSLGTPAPATPVVTAPVSKVPAVAIEYDLSVFLTSDKRAFGENEIILFTISYKNKKDTGADDAVLKAQIPQYTTVEDAAGGVVSGSQIIWDLKTVKGNGDGKVVYKLKVGLLDKAEVNSSVTASISASGKNVYDLDDSSVYPILLYSNRFGDNQHKKYVVGYKDNTFLPESSITRAEVAAMITRVLNIPEGKPGDKVYADIPQQHWAYGYIYAATKSGLFEGYIDNTFKPDAYITRAELSTALARYLKLKNIAPSQFHFKDISKHWARNYIEEIYRLKLIAGYQDGTFLPDAKIKRVETVTIINRMLYRGPLNGAVVSFKDVKKDYWAYGHIAECSIDHYFTRNNDSLSSETLVNKEIK
ncbi:S-layer homology domain-containing protein [Pseudobacteroides cellulosolvens]|uniref:S-layer domain-containing protein n=1 Tax=Pseudobacteroides cellulosolvens ATCC 35603 = DSM 2933 TaxID=398512 RepID=A0A0L6JUR1_9FIRM|nr:S-layer homology domain-containing protein [Pseudobacteroides cellulosolvens]KNY29563.1 S-layer domain-containing protein [Pseudobacteroides cellulosolvens ATCC 35603 = DSM 2933]